MKQSGTIKRLRWPLLAVLVAGLSVGGWMVSQSQAGNAPEKKEKKEQPAPIYELAAADVNTISLRELPVHIALHGSLIPARSATIKARAAGVVLESLVEEGMSVQQGQILARIDTADLQARLASQQAAVDEARARLSMAQKNHHTNQALLQQKYISQNAYDQVQNSVELAEANLKSARAQLDVARIALADSVVRAPFAGVISKRYLQAGDKAAPDMPVFGLVNLERLTLEAAVPAAEVARIHAGQDVQFSVDGMEKKRFTGKVERINPTADPASRTLTVYVQVQNDGSLKGGMYARGVVAVEKSRQTPVMPLLALRQEGGQDVVYLIKNGELKTQAVKLGVRNEAEGVAEVSQGLQAGDEVLLTRSDSLKPGSKVKLPQKAGKAAALKPGRMA
ncbi:efflux RND transporter periplasmic adaptor subunit [Massilia sp. W12]|uniref:efflux RND transporter periplasmic adaptor subunit n=1 Tax=Massilia sp. W12 TaxID=3126507 RepID=UPI0030D2CE0D